MSSPQLIKQALAHNLTEEDLKEQTLLIPSRKHTEQVKRHICIKEEPTKQRRASIRQTGKYRGQFPTITEEIKHDSENPGSYLSSARNCEVSSEELEDTPLTRLMESGLDMSGAFPKPSYNGSPYRVHQSSVGGSGTLQQFQVYQSMKDYKMDTLAQNNAKDDPRQSLHLSENLGTVSMGSKSISIDPGDEESEEQKSQEFILNLHDHLEKEQDEEEEEFEHQVPAPIQALAVTDMCQLSSNEIEKLKLKLSQQMRFMNMVVHDMRNPTVSTKLGLESTLEHLLDAEENINNLLKIASQGNLSMQDPAVAECASERKSLMDSKSFLKPSREPSSQIEEFTLGQINSMRVPGSERSDRQDSERKHDVNKASSSVINRINKIQQEFSSGQDTILDVLSTWQAEWPSAAKGEASPTLDEEDENEIADEDPSSGWEYFKECKTSRIIQDKVDTVMGQFSTILRASQVDINLPTLSVASDILRQTIKDCFNHEGLAFDPVPYLRIFDKHQCQGECGGRGGIDTSKSLVLSLAHMEQQQQQPPVSKKEIHGLQRKFSIFCQVYQDELDALVHDIQGLVAQSRLAPSEAGLLGRSQKIMEELRSSASHLPRSIKGAKALVQNQILTQTMIENLVDDLLDLAKMQNDSFKFSYDYFDLSATVLKAFEILMHSAHERGVEMKASVEKKSDLKFLSSVYGDSRRFIQIILNFMSNSIKFTPSGGSVRVLFRVLDCQEMPMKPEFKKLSDEHSEKEAPSPTQYYVSMAISVIDSGVGISEEGKKSLFVDFNKLEENANLNAKGTGLGLSICKMIIEKFGGTVEIESEPDSGCEFIIKLNLKCQVFDLDSPRFGHVLDSQELDGSQVQHPSFTSYQSTDQEYYDFLHKPQSASNIISQIKKRPTHSSKKGDAQNNNTMSFGVAHPDDHDEEEPLPVLGMNLQADQPRIVSKSVHIRKTKGPDCDTDSVAEAAADINDSMPSSRNPLQLNSSSLVFSFDPSRKMKCLVANDEPLQLTFLTAMFEKNGFEVTTALNGHEAFIKIQESFEQAELAKMFDLIILDLNMPISDGYDSCQKIRRLYSQEQWIDFNDPQRKASSNSILAPSTGQSNLATKSENQSHIRLEDKDFLPLLIALTSHVDDKVEQKTEEVGFMMTMMTPLQDKQIEQDIMPILKERLWKITRKVRLIEFYENNVSLRQYLRKESRASLSLASNAIRQSTKSLSQLLSNDHQLFSLSSKKLLTGQKHLNKMLLSSENLFYGQFDKPLHAPHRFMSDSLGNIMTPLPLKKVSSQQQQQQKRFSMAFSTSGGDLDCSSSVSNSFREASRGGTRQPAQKSKFAQIEVSKRSTLTNAEQSNTSYSSEEDSEDERPVLGTVESR